MRGGTPVSTPYRYTGQREEETLGLYYYGARWYDPELRRFIQPDSIVPQPGNPQALNRYSYCLNNPVKYTDPTGHQALAWAQTMRFPGQSLVGALMIALEAVNPVPLDPVVIPIGLAMIANDPLWQTYGPYLPAMIDKASEAGRNLVQGGNTAGPGGLDPNDPWRWGQNYRANYERYYSASREVTHEVHHVLPRQFREILARASQGRINVDDPRWLREVLKIDPTTGTPIHQRLYTDVWVNWAQELGREPTAQEIIRFARQLAACRRETTSP